MLSSVPKLVDKNFVVGFIIPVLLGAVGILALLRDLEPFRSVYDSMAKADDFPKLTIVILLLWTAAIVLMIMNNALYRMLEGYVGPFNRRAWRDRLAEQYAADRQRLKTTYEIITNPRVWVSPELKRDYYRDARQFCDSWPSRHHLVLPTRFGNVIRAFETYAEVNYGVDSIPAWLRLQGVMSKDARGLVDDARAQVDFFVNVWFFAVLFTVIAAGRCIGKVYAASPDPGRMFGTSWGFAVAALGGLLVCRLAYAGAMECARAWGDLVKSAFDLYLPALAGKLGYELPAAASQRRRFWGKLTSSFLYQEPMKPEEWPAAKPATASPSQGDGSRADAPGDFGEDDGDDDDDSDERSDRGFV
jgi:hypothetical protein